MARNRNFDRDTVLLAAANAFRQRSYRDISIAELEKATGLVSGSIYNAFGSKAGLFRAALAAYVHGFVADRLKQYAGQNATLEDLEGLFLSLLEPPLSDGFGCLVTNSIIEFGQDEGVGAEDLDSSLLAARQAISGVLARELGEEAAARSTMQLLALYHGILTLSRSRLPLHDLAQAVRSAFDGLREMRVARPRSGPDPEQPGDKA